MCFHAKISFPCGERLVSRMSTDPKIQQYLKRKTLSRAWHHIKPLRDCLPPTGVSHWYKTFPGCSHDPNLAPGLSYAGVNQEWHGLTSVFQQRCLQEQGHLFPWLLNNCLQDLVTWVIAGDKMDTCHCLTDSTVLWSYCGWHFMELYGNCANPEFVFKMHPVFSAIKCILSKKRWVLQICLKLFTSCWNSGQIQWIAKVFGSFGALLTATMFLTTARARTACEILIYYASSTLKINHMGVERICAKPENLVNL